MCSLEVLAGVSTLIARKRNQAAEKALLSALAFGATVEHAARKAGITERTAFRRLADPAFRARLEELRRQAIARTSGMLTGAALGLAARLEMLEAVLRKRKENDLQ